MPTNLKTIYDQLFSYCEAREFAGLDPFDGLNSRLFQLTPLKHFQSNGVAAKSARPKVRKG